MKIKSSAPSAYSWPARAPSAQAARPAPRPRACRASVVHAPRTAACRPRALPSARTRPRAHARSPRLLPRACALQHPARLRPCRLLAHAAYAPCCALPSAPAQLPSHNTLCVLQHKIPAAKPMLQYTTAVLQYSQPSLLSCNINTTLQYYFKPKHPSCNTISTALSPVYCNTNSTLQYNFSSLFSFFLQYKNSIATQIFFFHYIIGSSPKKTIFCSKNNFFVFHHK